MASLSLDLDNEWAYLKTHGDSNWKAYPSYLGVVVPRIVEMLSRHELNMTVFVVGKDASLATNYGPLAEIAGAGHEIGNHSQLHEPWLHLYSEVELEKDIAEAEAHIEAATGQKPCGFRGPGFSYSLAMLRVLARRGYSYDASTLPSYIGPLARLYYFATGQFSPDERKRLGRLFGSWRDGFRPLRPYRWSFEGGELTEIPVTTFPWIRIPIHLSYVMYLAGYSPALAYAYFRTALRACSISGIQPSILLHPLEFLDGSDVPSLRFFPSMGIPLMQKLSVVERCIGYLKRLYDVRTLAEHAVAVAADRQMLEVVPNEGHL